MRCTQSYSIVEKFKPCDSDVTGSVLKLTSRFCVKVLSDEVKRKQYDTYGTAGFGQNHARQGQQQYYRAGQASIDPEELFRSIFGEFTGATGFGDIHKMFEQRPEVCTAFTVASAQFSGTSNFELCYSIRFILFFKMNVIDMDWLCLSTVCDGAHVFRGSQGCKQGTQREH